jgi:hypothetical protein
MWPSFLNMWPAAIAAGLAVPTLLVLYFLKLRRQERAVSSTLLWKKAVQDLQVNAPFQRLRRNLLLLLQLLILAFLLLALARPVVSVTPGAGDLAVILIDRSASMSASDLEGGRTRLDEAKRRAKELVDSMTRNSQAMVIAFDETAEPVQQWTTDAVALRRAIDSIQPTDRRSRLEMAYKLAEAQTAYGIEAGVEDESGQSRGGPRPDVWLFSDGRMLDNDRVSIRADVKYHRIGTETAKNVGIVALEAKRNYERPTEVQIFARLANFGAEPVNADVQLSISPGTEGNQRFTVSRVASATLLPERWSDAEREKAEREENLVARDSVEFTIELLDAAVVRVEQMARAGDVLAADDVAHVVVPPPKHMEVLLVSDGNWYLEQLMTSLNLQGSRTMIPSSYETNVPTNYDLIIFDRYAPRQLPPAGNFIYFGAVAEGLSLRPRANDGMYATASDVGVLDWQRDHPMLRHLSLSRLYAAETLLLDVPMESRVLIEGTKGPMVVFHQEGRRKHLVVTFDLLQSNWPLRVSFPIFMNNALQFLAIGSEMDVRQSYAPGAQVSVPQVNLQRAGMPPRVRLIDPRGQGVELAVPQTTDLALPALNRVGVYRLDPPIPGFEAVAVNLLDYNESNLLPVESPPGGIGEKIEAGEGRARLELWWWLVAALALPVLFIEWWVYTRRVHL